jgi:regulator of ribonuclease activity A
VSVLFATAELCDAFPDRVKVVEPIFRDWGGAPSFAGPIETVRVFEDNGLVRGMLESEGGGRVLVVDGGGSLRTALVGGRLAALALEKGWSGLVVNGCIRDAAEIAVTAIGVKALHTVPMKSAKAAAGEGGRPVRFGGVTFTPGHWLYADRDGIVVADRELTLG